MNLRERISLAVRAIIAEGHKQEEIASILSEHVDGDYRYTRQAVSQWINMQTSPNPHKLDEVYHNAPQGTLAKMIALRVLNVFPPEDGDGSKPE